MSIYATAISFDADNHEPECVMWVEVEGDEGPRQWGLICDGRKYWLDKDRDCTCRCGPIAYQGSHVLPADTDRRAGSFSACYIPGFIERTGRPPVSSDEDHDYPAHPWLRVWVDEGDTDESVSTESSSATLLDREQVSKLHAFLGEWLEAQTRDEGDTDA
jgi:hypothetical protein